MRSFFNKVRKGFRNFLTYCMYFLSAVCWSNVTTELEAAIGISAV